MVPYLEHGRPHVMVRQRLEQDALCSRLGIPRQEDRSAAIGDVQYNAVAFSSGYVPSKR